MKRSLKVLYFTTFIAVFAIISVILSPKVNAKQIEEDTVLDADVTDGIHIPSGKTVTLDLNGKTVTGVTETTESSTSNTAIIVNEGTLIIKGEGTVTATPGSYAVLNRDGKLTIEGGTYNKENGANNASLIVNGWANGEENTDKSYSEMIINGGLFDGGTYTVIKNDSWGKLTINNGIINTTPKVVGTNTTYNVIGIQETGSGMTVNGGTFNAQFQLENLASEIGEIKDIQLNGGTFNGAVSTKGYTKPAYANAVNISIEKDCVFNHSLSIANSGAPSGTLPFKIEKLDVRSIGGSLTLSGNSSALLPAVTLDGFTIGGSLTLSSAEPSVIKNTVVKGSTGMTAGNVEIINVKARLYANNAKNATVTFGGGTEITNVKVTYNEGNTIIVDGAKINSLASNGTSKAAGYENIIIKSGEVGTISATKGNIDIQGGVVDTVNIINKVTTNVVTVKVTEGAILNKIINERTDEETYSITLPETYSQNEDGTIVQPLFDEDITLDKASYTYNGKAFTPGVTVKHGNKTLVKGTDYKVTYSSNTNVGTAKVIIEGLGNYAGKVEKTFKINPAKLTSSSVTGIVNKVYNKHNQTQGKLVVKFNGKTLKKNTDYTVSYKNNKNIGKATVVVKGKGNYTGTVNKYFNIYPVKIAIKKFKVSGNSIRVYYYAPAGGVKYQVAYKQSGNKTYKYVKTSKTNYVAKHLKYHRKYYFKVRPYKVVNGKTYYGAWASIKTKTTHRK